MITKLVKCVADVPLVALVETAGLIAGTGRSLRNVGLKVVEAIDIVGSWVLRHWEKLSDHVANFIADSAHWIARVFARARGRNFEQSEEWRAFTRAALLGLTPAMAFILAQLVLSPAAMHVVYAVGSGGLVSIIGAGMADRKYKKEELKKTLATEEFTKRAEENLSPEALAWLRAQFA